MKNQDNRNWKEDMTQEEIEKVLKEIEASARDVVVPETLEPEAVKQRLRSRRRRRSVRRLTEIAAAAALVVTISGTGIIGMVAKDQKDTSGVLENAVENSTNENGAGIGAAAADIEQPMPKTKQVGEYRLAESYDDVYAALERQAYRNESEFDGIVDGIIGGAIFNEQEIKSEFAAESGAADGNMSADSSMTTGADMGAGGKELGNAEAEDMAEGGSDHSDTNTQVAGVDESDFIKNDGSYLYIQTSDQVSIVDIRAKKMKQLMVFTPQMGAGDSIRDMYVDGDRLFIIIQKHETQMEESKAEAARKSEPYDEAYAVDCVTEYYLSEDTKMALLTYDISDRSQAKLLGTVEQDGSYYESRRVGEYIYLFSRKDAYPYEAWSTGENGTKAGGEEDGGLIPEVNGQKVSADCIYVRDQASMELIISSVRVTEPDRTVDQMVLMDQYAQIYMSTEAIYLYASSYDWDDDGGSSYTNIAKFSYKDGHMNGVAAANVRGEIMDVFAISESGRILRVLTTEWATGGSKNQLYLMDEKLNVLGTLKNIATGEEIYAARYIGNTAYFITYHNTDPLFAVDISNPANPKLLGQVEITGFSDYLHPYGDGLLLGIGYETDPDTSERLGVKLVMFDIQNPTELKIQDAVTSNGSHCSAAHSYKSAFVDSAKNLIGFEVTDWGENNGDQIRYQLYGWDGSRFVKRLSEKIDSDKCWNMEQIRGLYAGDTFYLVNQMEEGYQIRSYDMKADFQSLDELIVK